MSDKGIAGLAIVIALVPVVIYMTVRYVVNAIDEARRDASEAWKEVLGERTARSKLEAELVRLRSTLPLPLAAPPLEGATAPVSRDTLKAILRANGEPPPRDFVEDDPTGP